MKPIRVLIVDDSPVFQSILRGMLAADANIEVVGAAADPIEARDLIIATSPDVITLDIEMPRMDGITFLKHLMSHRPMPVIMISSYTRANSLRTLEALDAGAFDFVAKPGPGAPAELRALQSQIIMKVKAAAQVQIKPSPLFGKLPNRKLPLPASTGTKVIAIGASTGGPLAIQKLLSALPPIAGGVVIVQHMPARFTQAFAQRLNILLPLDIKEAKTGDRLGRGRVLLAPGDHHLELASDSRGYYVQLQDGPPIKHQRPSVDVLFRSVACSAGANAIGVLLTGMGDDGSDGLLAMKRAGAYTVAQDEATSVVFGMPRAAIERGAVDIVAPLEKIARVILTKLQHDQLANGKK